MVELKIYEIGDENRVDLINYPFIESTTPLVSFLESYHSYEVRNIERIPKNGGGIIIGNHGFIAYDMYLLAFKYYELHKKMWRGLTDHVIFKIPILREIFLALGIVDGNRKMASQLLENEEFLIVFPGGSKEAMKSSKERYKLKWDGRYGFLKMALKHRVPIVPTICIGIDDIFDVHVDGYELAGKFGLKDFPLPIFSGRFGLPIPKPIKLTHYIGEPIYFTENECNSHDDINVLRKIQKRVKKVLEKMLIDGLKERELWDKQEN
ncbi:acyltransferase family protein [bacterium]|nr:acyltransferase family protein [bacterium]